ncbi:MAG TPA: CopD family protein [Burkholderiales bacterium]|nr:CopD family protein [Burkholderiales bacterium]
MEIARWLHVLAVVVWVGGMFFAYVVLRPTAATLLEPPQRLPLWQATLKRFFVWVWIAAGFILGSGAWMIHRLGGFTSIGVHVHLMLGVGVAMMLIFAHVFFAPFARLTRGVQMQDWKAAGAALSQIRRLVGLNLLLGLITISVATVGRLLG